VFRTLVAVQQRHATDDPGRTWPDYRRASQGPQPSTVDFGRALPHAQRYQPFAAPFAGLVAPIMRVLGNDRPSGSTLPGPAMAERPADKSPRVCQSCFSFIATHHGGGEIEASFMFADIRRSTTLAEHMSAGQVHSRFDGFYATARPVVFEQDGAVDKFVAQRSRD
jgi:hypothetical protein